MPTVGKKTFPYTKPGEAKAKAFAKKTGKKLTVKKPAKPAMKRDADGDGY